MKSCATCGNYCVFYTMDKNHFKRESFGNCKIDNIIKNIDETCEMWRSNHHLRRQRKELCEKTLAAAVNCIIEVKQILDYEQEDNKLTPLIIAYDTN